MPVQLQGQGGDEDPARQRSRERPQGCPAEQAQAAPEPA